MGLHPTGHAGRLLYSSLILSDANSQVQTAQKWQEYFDDLAEKFEALTRVLPRLREYERMYDNKRLFLALQAAYLGIIEFCMEVMNTFRKANKGEVTSRADCLHLSIIELTVVQAHSHACECQAYGDL